MNPIDGSGLRPDLAQRRTVSFRFGPSSLRAVKRHGNDVDRVLKPWQSSLTNRNVNVANAKGPPYYRRIVLSDLDKLFP